MAGRLSIVVVFMLWSASVLAQTPVEVFIEGVDASLEKNVRLFLSLEQQKGHELLTEGRLRRLHQKAPKEIELALQPFGFYRPEIKSELKKMEGGRWQARYRIDTGPAVTIQALNILLNEAIQQDPSFMQLMAGLPLKKGDVFVHQGYEDIKSSLLRLASERGYFAARFSDNRVEVDVKNNSARVLLNFDGGQRYRFGDVNVSQDVLQPKLMQRYIGFKKGEPYHLNELLSLQQALNDSDFFQSVEVSPGEPDASTLFVPVNIALSARKKNRYSLGLGFGTDTGARMRLGWEKPLVNDRGHRFKTELDVSEIGNSLSAHYSVPVLNPRTDRLVYSAGLVNETTDTSDSRLQTLGVSLNRNRSAWREKLSLEYQKEDFKVADISDTSRLLIPGAVWSRSWASDIIFTLDGLRLDIGIQGASEQLLSDVNFVQLQGGVKFIQRLGGRNRLIARGRLGSTWTQNFAALPSSVRFFTGGAQSVRGYAYQTLGPEDADGDVEGGRHLMVGSLELDHQLQGNWGVALFYDAGNAINQVDETLERGAGFGLRWKSPVGPVRIDLASAISREGEPWRLHINIGPDL